MRELKKVEAQCALLEENVVRVSQLFAPMERIRERAMLGWHTAELVFYGALGLSRSL